MASKKEYLKGVDYLGELQDKAVNDADRLINKMEWRILFRFLGIIGGAMIIFMRMFIETQLTEEHV